MSLWLSETQLNIISKTILLETHFIRRVDSFSGCVIITTFNEYNPSVILRRPHLLDIYIFIDCMQSAESVVITQRNKRESTRKLLLS